MAFQHSMQSSRYEFKYLIDEAKSRSIRDYVRRFLVPDPYNKPELGGRYHVHSVYCDSRDLRLYQATQQGDKNRFKLRIRFYNDDRDQPAFLEIKRRDNTVIKKQRAIVSKAAATRLVRGERLSPGDLRGKNAKQFAALDEFWNLYQAIQARPQVCVSYSREAYVQPNADTVRLTFDRALLAGHLDMARLFDVPQRFTQADLPCVLLELKFTDRYPDWMEGLAIGLNLTRTSFAKYTRCIDAIRDPRLSARGFHVEVA